MQRLHSRVACQVCRWPLQLHRDGRLQHHPQPPHQRSHPARGGEDGPAVAAEVDAAAAKVDDELGAEEEEGIGGDHGAVAHVDLGRRLRPRRP